MQGNAAKKIEASGPQSGPLASTTKSVVGKVLSDCKTEGFNGETVVDCSAIFKRLEKYRLQAVARVILGKRHRLTTCLRLIRKNVETYAVQVWRSIKFDRCHYGNLVCCGSVWVCPVCAAKIVEKRRAELIQATNYWKAEGGTIAMLTLTAPHRRNQNVGKLCDAFRTATKSFRNRSAWRTFITANRVFGTVTALEVTWGEANGWHVHTHTLLFIDDAFIDVNNLDTSTILGTWQKACVKAGLDMPNEHGLDLANARDAAKYVTKFGEDGEQHTNRVVTWSVADELTKSHVKKGKFSVTPWDMLRLVAETGECLFEQLFKQFAAAFHGKRQLVWSPGLRDQLGLEEELTDEELAIKQDDDAELLGVIAPDEWEYVLAADRRGELLEVARLEGWEGVLRYIAKCRAMIAEKDFQRSFKCHYIK